MSQSFVLCHIPPSALSSTASLPTAPPLHLLPFSLGPNSAPYKSPTAPITDFFQPRPCPPNTPGISDGTPIASFRGRQVVGQIIPVPKGYQGVILRTSEAPTLTSSATEQGGKSERNARNKWPPTPASSAASASTASISTISEDGISHDGASGIRSSPRKVGWMTRVKGAGQIALSRPKTRQAQGSIKKRKFRLDSDDEAEPEASAAPATVDDDEPLSRVLPPTRTPSKRLRASQSTPGSAPSPDIPPVEGLPAITLQTPTPRKDPGPPRIRRLPRGARSADYVIPGSQHPPGAEDIPTRSSSLRALDSIASDTTLVDEPMEMSTPMKREESVIPSPATENDPPAFDVDSVVDIKSEKPRDEEQEEWSVGSQRRLKAISSFDSITLWTPDMPLPGWDADEAIAKLAAEVDDDKTKIAETSLKAESGIKLRSGWWPFGGAGEGGDEFVRAMGEYLGLMEVLNKPVYLDDVDQKEDESDEDI